MVLKIKMTSYLIWERVSSHFTENVLTSFGSFHSDENVAPVVSHRYEAPPRPVPPPGVDDFDLENWNDPLQCSEYAMEIFQYYKSREVRYCNCLVLINFVLHV